MPDTLSLDNKVAVVTGGSRGTGAAIARRLARNDAAFAISYAGAQPTADDVVRGIVAAGGRAFALRADAAEPDSVRCATVVRCLARLLAIPQLPVVLTITSVQPVDSAGRGRVRLNRQDQRGGRPRSDKTLTSSAITGTRCAFSRCAASESDFMTVLARNHFSAVEKSSHRASEIGSHRSVIA